MNTRIEKTQESKSQSQSEGESKMMGGGESTLQVVDNRAEAIAQRKLQEAINNSLRVQQQKGIQEAANNSPQVRQMKAIQTAANNHQPRIQPLMASGSRAGLSHPSTLQRKESGEAQGAPDHVSNSPVVQRESYLDTKTVDSDYHNEQTVQRGDLMEAIEGKSMVIKNHLVLLRTLERVKAGNLTLDGLKIKIGNRKEYEQVMQGDNAEEISRRLRVEYERELESLRLQDIQIDDLGNLNKEALKNRLVEYDETPDGQAKTKVEISGGSLNRSATHDRYPSQPVDTSDSVTHQTGKGWEIFVMSPSGNLHMASHKIGKYHHSSLLAGIPVAGAGSIQAAGGQIQVLNDKSGHYKPTTQQTLQVCHMLKKKGVDLSKVQLDLPHSKINGPADQFLTDGSEESIRLESKEIQKAMQSNIQTHGLVKLQVAFKEHGWMFYKEGDRYVIRKADGDEPTLEELEALLHQAFVEEEEDEDEGIPDEEEEDQEMDEDEGIPDSDNEDEGVPDSDNEDEGIPDSDNED
jgi:hypothetical protein